jgi:long-subunit fatty acid transport protein
MEIEPSARHSGMGNAGVALDQGIQSVFYNPAALGAMDQNAVQFTHSEWFAGINYDYAAAALPMRGWGTFLAGVTALGSGDIEVRTVEMPLGTGELYSVSDVALSLGFGRQITSRFAAGAQLNYVHEAIWNSSQHHVTVNVGSVYRLSENGVKLGASIANIGTQARYDGRDLAILFDKDPSRYGDNSALPAEQFTDNFPVPVLFRVGISYPKALGEASRLLLAADAFHPSDNTESVSGGAEWSFKNSLALRAGYQHLFEEDSDV